MSIFSKIKSTVSNVVSKVTGKSNTPSSSSGYTSTTTSSSGQAPSWYGGGSTSSGTSSGGTSSSSSGGGGITSSQDFYTTVTGKEATSPVYKGGGGGGSYNPATQTYTSSSGVSSSISYAPAGSLIQTTSQKNQQIARDAGVTPSSSVISTYKAPTLSDIPSYVKTNIGQQGAYKTLKTAGGIAFGAVAGYTVAQWNKLTDKEKRNVISNQRTSEEAARIEAGARKGEIPVNAPPYVSRGTISPTVQTYTEQEIINAAISGKITEQQAVNIISNRKISEIKNSLQNEVNSGSVTVDEANKALEKESIQINKDVNKVSDKIKLGKAIAYSPLYVAGGFATGGILGVIGGISAGAGIGLTAAGVGVAGLTAISIGDYFYQSAKQGVLTKERVGATLIPITTFGAGAYAGARFASPKINEVQLKNAINNAEYITEVKGGYISESSIKKLNLPDKTKIELENQLKSGGSLRRIEIKIKGATPQDEAILNKALPSKTTEIYELTTSSGQKINVGSYGKIKIRGSSQELISRGAGTVNKETGIGQIERVTITKGKQGISSIEKTKDIFKSSAKENKVKETGEILRGIKSKSFKFKGEKIQTEDIINNPITQEQIKKVLQSQYANIPESQTNYKEIQQLKKVNVVVNEGEIYGYDKLYKTIAGKGSNKKVIKPIEFERLPSTKSVKGFEEATIPPEQINKVIKESSKITKGKQVSETKTNQQLEEFNVPVQDFSESIKSSLKSGIRNVNTPKPILNLKSENKLNVNQITSPVSINVPKIREEQVIAPVIKPIQIQKTIEKIQPVISPTNINPQSFTPTDFGYGFGFALPSLSSGAGQRKKKTFKGKSKRAEPKYAAGLGYAAFQAKPIKVSKKQFEKLVKIPKFSSLPVLEIINEKELKKKVKAVNF